MAEGVLEMDRVVRNANGNLVHYRQQRKLTVRVRFRRGYYYAIWWNRSTQRQREEALKTEDYAVARQRANEMERLLNEEKLHPSVLKETTMLTAFVPLIPPARPGVYAVVGPPGYVKIGKSSNIKERVRTLRSACTHEVQLVAVLSDNPDDEEKFQSALEHCKVKGEWYLASWQVLRMIRKARSER